MKYSQGELQASELKIRGICKKIKKAQEESEKLEKQLSLSIKIEREVLDRVAVLNKTSNWLKIEYESQPQSSAGLNNLDRSFYSEMFMEPSMQFQDYYLTQISPFLRPIVRAKLERTSFWKKLKFIVEETQATLEEHEYLQRHISTLRKLVRQTKYQIQDLTDEHIEAFDAQKVRKLR